MPKILVLCLGDKRKSFIVYDELSKRRHQVDVITPGERLPEARYDMYSSIILDMRKAQAPGKVADFCKYLRQSSRKPIVVLAENECLEDKIASLKNGADDYMAEPIDLAEMEARLRAILRRHPPESGQVLESADMILERSACRVRRGLKYINLFPMEFKLLEFFMQHPNTTFSAEVLYQRLWNSSPSQNPDTVRTFIKTLRRKIDYGRCQALVKTVHGKGYRFVGLPSATSEDAAIPA
jgi:DNA-binding response OmpR family regulator